MKKKILTLLLVFIMITATIATVAATVNAPSIAIINAKNVLKKLNKNSKFVVAVKNASGLSVVDANGKKIANVEITDLSSNSSSIIKKYLVDLSDADLSSGAYELVASPVSRKNESAKKTITVK